MDYPIKYVPKANACAWKELPTYPRILYRNQVQVLRSPHLPGVTALTQFHQVAPEFHRGTHHTWFLISKARMCKEVKRRHIKFVESMELLQSFSSSFEKLLPFSSVRLKRKRLKAEVHYRGTLAHKLFDGPWIATLGQIALHCLH